LLLVVEIIIGFSFLQVQKSGVIDA